MDENAPHDVKSYTQSTMSVDLSVTLYTFEWFLSGSNQIYSDGGRIRHITVMLSHQKPLLTSKARAGRCHYSAQV